MTQVVKYKLVNGSYVATVNGVDNAFTVNGQPLTLDYSTPINPQPEASTFNPGVLLLILAVGAGLIWLLLMRGDRDGKNSRV